MTIDEIEQEGRDDFKRGRSAHDCPYTFDKSEYWERKDYSGFETVRWKLNAWMKGWIEEKKLIGP